MTARRGGIDWPIYFGEAGGSRTLRITIGQGLMDLNLRVFDLVKEANGRSGASSTSNMHLFFWAVIDEPVLVRRYLDRDGRIYRPLPLLFPIINTTLTLASTSVSVPSVGFLQRCRRPLHAFRLSRQVEVDHDSSGFISHCPASTSGFH